MAGKALTAVILEAYVQGVSTRSADDLSGISKGQVSRPCGEIDYKGGLSRPARSRGTGRIGGSAPPM